jgi:hypothetical protein
MGSGATEVTVGRPLPTVMGWRLTLRLRAGRNHMWNATPTRRRERRSTLNQKGFVARLVVSPLPWLLPHCCSPALKSTPRCPAGAPALPTRVSALSALLSAFRAGGYVPRFPPSV